MGGFTVTASEQRKYFRRRAEQRREHRAALDGSAGPASVCRRVDPPHQIKSLAGQLTLTTSAPKVQIIKRSSFVKRAYRSRLDTGGRVPRIPLADYGGTVALALDLRWLLREALQKPPSHRCIVRADTG